MKKNLFAPAAICLFILIVAGPAAASTGDDSSVTIDHPLNGLYSMGDAISFSGTNTISPITYLFITGSGLKTNGAQIPGMQSPVIDGDAATFALAGVGPDHRWSYTLETRNMRLGNGTFTIHAVSAPRDLAHINNTQSGTVSFLKLPPGQAPGETAGPIIITRPGRQNISQDDILPMPAVSRSRDGITFSGTAKGSPDPGLSIWIFTWDSGPEHRGSGYSWAKEISPDATGTYSQIITDTSVIRRMGDGNYCFIVQHPMQNKILDIDMNFVMKSTMPEDRVRNRMLKNKDVNGTDIFTLGGSQGLTGKNACDALIEAFKDPGVDDIIAISPPPAVTSAGPGTAIPVVDSPERDAVVQTRKGFSDAVSAAGPAFEVDSVVVDPAGDLASGTPVTVSYRVNISGTGTEETFPAADELQMSTGLEKPRWEYTLVLDGVENPQPGSNGRVLGVSGWLLSYPSSFSESLKVTLSGTTPGVQSPGNVTLFTVREYDSHNNPVAGSEISRTARNNPGTDQPVLSGNGAQANPAIPVTSGGTIEKIRAGFSTVSSSPPVTPAAGSPKKGANECITARVAAPEGTDIDGLTLLSIDDFPCRSTCC